MRRRAFLQFGAASLATSILPVGAAAAVLADAAATRLGRSIRGEVFAPGAADYERLRRGFAADVDLRPLMVVRPASAADVVRIVRFARDQRLPLAVRGGGHSYAGYNSCDGGIVIDMSGLRALAMSEDRLTMRVGGGALSGHVEQESAKAGCATALSQCPGVGVGGYLLGGGVGPLMSRYGLGCDNVTAAEIVLADGRIVTASEREYPDLFWAIRGGGGNFGVVTAFTVKLHEVTAVLGGYLTYRSPNPADLLGVLRDLAASAPDSQTLIATLAPDHETAFSLSVQACDAGDLAAGERRLAPFRKSRLLASDTVIVQRYLDLEQQVPFDIPPMYRENRGGFIPDLSDAVVAALSTAMATAPDGDVALLHLHGAVATVTRDATAFPLRAQGFAHNVAARWSPKTGRERAAAWVRETARSLAPFGSGAYVNVMGREDAAAVRAAYGGNYARLAATKAKYDPANLFSINQNIEPPANG